MQRAYDEFGIAFRSYIEEIAADRVGQRVWSAGLKYVSPVDGNDHHCVPAGFHRPYRHGQLYAPGSLDHLQVHPGVDVSLPVGHVVQSMAHGEVLRSGKARGTWGHLIIVGHEDGMVSRYGHCKPLSDVYVGQEVSARDAIGVIEKLPWFDPHGHFEIVSRSLYEVSAWDWWDGKRKHWLRNQSFYVDPEIHIREK